MTIDAVGLEKIRTQRGKYANALNLLHMADVLTPPDGSFRIWFRPADGQPDAMADAIITASKGDGSHRMPQA